MHGRVARQVAGGLAGAIIVRDDLDTDPALAGATERVMVLADPRVGASSSVLDVSMTERMQGREGDGVLVNGLRRPVLAARAGTLEHWRIVNASASRYQRLVLDGNDLELIGTDGGRLTAPQTVGEVLLAPAERVELLVAPARAGTYALRALPYDRGTVGMGAGTDTASGSRSTTAAVVATLSVAGDAPAAALPAALAAPSTLDPGAATGSRELVLGMGMGAVSGGMGGMGGAGGGGGGGGAMAFTIDAKTFDPSRTDITTRLERVEDWTIRNTSTMDHPFHLHVWPFRMIARSGRAPLEPGWKDTVNVPAGESVTVRVPFLDRITGRTVYHCHILDHEDHGMMGILEVTPTRR
jgi:FtsP/CotA-like multicopper oxidase with cupredoxin domain